jgi:hypothetical protein
VLCDRANWNNAEKPNKRIDPNQEGPRRAAFGQCPLWVKSGHHVVKSPCPLSALCQKRTKCIAAKSALFDYFVGGGDVMKSRRLMAVPPPRTTSEIKEYHILDRELCRSPQPSGPPMARFVLAMDVQKGLAGPFLQLVTLPKFAAGCHRLGVEQGENACLQGEVLQA